MEGISGGGEAFGNLCNFYLKPPEDSNILKSMQKLRLRVLWVYINLGHILKGNILKYLFIVCPFSMDAVRPSSYMSNVLFSLCEPL